MPIFRPSLFLRLSPSFFRYFSTAISIPTYIQEYPPKELMLKLDWGPNGALFPQLPEIKNPDVNSHIFTHRSYYGRPTHIFEDSLNDLSPDNEKYEHLGDSVLGLCVTSLLNEMFPGLRVGPATKIRALIVGNTTLAEICLKYKLLDNLRLHPAQAITLRASVHVQADVLESFIGGLYIEQGLDAASKWLYPLFRPYAESAYKTVREQHGLPPPSSSCSLDNISSTKIEQEPPGTSQATVGHLALFNQLLQKDESRIEWIYSDSPESLPDKLANDVGDLAESVSSKGAKTTPMWYVKVIVNGKFYGQGRGGTKKSARNQAAKVGLKLMGMDV